MNYQDTIKNLYNEKGEELFSNPTMLKSMILDYVNNNPSDCVLIDVITKLLSEYQIVDYLATKEFEAAKNGLLDIYQKDNYDCSEEEFINAINPLLEIFYPDDKNACNENLQNEHNDTNNDKEFDKVSIDFNAKKITVIPSNEDEICVNDGLGNDVTSKVCKTSNGVVDITPIMMENFNDEITINLPLKKYKELNIISKGDLNICSNNNDILSINKVKIELNSEHDNGMDNNINLEVNTNHLTIDTNMSRNIYVSGDITNMKIKSTCDNTNVNAYIDSIIKKPQKKIKMVLESGDIKLVTDNTSLLERFKKATWQKGNGSTCEFINNIKEVDIITKNGKISSFLKE